MHSKDEFARRLREAFGGARNIDIAGQLGVSKATITLYTSGRLPPSDTLLTIAEKTGCNLHWLMTGQGTKWAQATDGLHRRRATVIALYHASGGTGKSVAASFLAMSLARRNYRTLLVETSGQYSTASFFLFPELRDRGISSRNSSTEHEDGMTRCLFRTPVGGLDLYPGSNHIYTHLKELGQNRYAAVPSELLQKYSFIIIDTKNDLLNEPDLLRARLMMSAKILMPCDGMRRESGIEDSLLFLQREQERSDEIEVFGAFVNMAEPKRRSGAKILGEIRRLLPGKALETVIHRDPKLWHCLMNNLGIHDLGPKTAIVKEYDQLTEEVMLRVNDGGEKVVAVNHT
jgi:cellulose biosynthesis protein BcsQ